MHRSKRRRRGRRGGTLLALLGLVFVVASSGFVAAWTGGLRALPERRTKATKVTKLAQVDSAPTMRITRSGAQNSQTCCRRQDGSVSVLPMTRCQDADGEAVDMSICSAVFRPVCCRRADSTPYWATAQWCDDIGAQVEDSLCQEESKEVCCEFSEATHAAGDRVRWVTRDTCIESKGEERSEERCSVLLENVCCEFEGKVSEKMRRECKAADHHEVDPSQCEPICCHRQSNKSIGWELRANCGGKNDTSTVMVSEGKCEEICCQMPDRTFYLADRPVCAARGGVVKSIVDCGTTVQVQKTDFTNTDKGDPPPPQNSSSATAAGDTGLSSSRPPLASPYF
jgi:hypothetical protein